MTVSAAPAQGAHTPRDVMDVKKSSAGGVGASQPTRRDSVITNSGANTGSELLLQHCGRIFDFMKREDGTVSKSCFLQELQAKGILGDDPRIADTMHRVRKVADSNMDREVFCSVVMPNIGLMEQIFADEFVIPDFEEFTEDLTKIYEECRPNTSGKMADYIPSLAKQNPDHWGVAVCTVDGQRCQIGNTDVEYCIQSCSKPITYALALEHHGKEKVHEHIGREPSGEEFNALKLNPRGRPHNPLINSGAIMACSLAGSHCADASERFDFVTKKWAALAGGKQLGFSNSVYLSERATADRNFALAYFMQENGAFPEGTKLVDTLEFYFQCCSLTMNADMMSVVAATVANGGVCPLTGETVLAPDTCRDVLSMMYSCGMYDYSGEFAFKIGLPAKSGVAGGVFVVIPNVMGIATFSPPLDKYGNSARGVEFFERLTKAFNFHNFDSLVTDSTRKDPRKRHGESSEKGVSVEDMIRYASLGDLSALKRLVVKGVDLSEGDYDHRTPLHLAASKGHLNVVKYLVGDGGVVDVNPVDRWGGTPWDDSYGEGHQGVAQFLQHMGGKTGTGRRKSKTQE